LHVKPLLIALALSRKSSSNQKFAVCSNIEAVYITWSHPERALTRAVEKLWRFLGVQAEVPGARASH
jgi:hypothetical protein